jgi:hypothetical protein
MGIRANIGRRKLLELLPTLSGGWTNMSETSDTWALIDDSVPEPYRDGTEEWSIESEEQLVELLEDFSKKEPRVLMLRSPGGALAFVGIGGPLAGVHYYANPSNRRSVSAKPMTTYANEDHWFTAVGEPARYKADFLMPVGRVIEILAHIFRTGDLPSWIEWV